MYTKCILYVICKCGDKTCEGLTALCYDVLNLCLFSAIMAFYALASASQPSFSLVIGISLSRVKSSGDKLYLTNPSIHFRGVLRKHYVGYSVNVAVGWQPFFHLFGISCVEISVQISAILTGMFPCFPQSLLSN